MHATLSLPTRILNYLKIKVENYTRPNKEFDLIIIDDLFPYLMTIFRVVEFNYYLEHIPNTVVYASGTALKFVKVDDSLPEVVSKYEETYPQHRGKVLKFDSRRKLRGKLAYTVFLHNTFTFLPMLERDSIPFVFTLYAGGTFELDNERSDMQLRKICASKMLRKIIVKEKVIRDYLINRQFCPADKIEFIFGGIMEVERLTKSAIPRPLYGHTKSTFDICFVGFKYMPRGSDKGYDTFVDTARLLCARHSDVRFHVVGGFSSDDIDVSDMADRFTFYGPRTIDFFLEFYARMDVLLSPNIPYTLGKGAFDGFPLGTVADAALSGVAIFCTDYLHENQAFVPGKDIEIINNDPQHLADTLTDYYEKYDRLIELGRNGRMKFAEVFSVEKQMMPRVALLNKLLKEITAA